MKRILVLACLLCAPIWAARVAQFQTAVEIPLMAEILSRQGSAGELIFSVEVRDRFQRKAYFDHCTGSYHATEEWNLSCIGETESIVLFGNRPHHRLSDLAVFNQAGQEDTVLYLNNFPKPEHPRGFLFNQNDCKGKIATHNRWELGGQIVWECSTAKETLVFSENGCQPLRGMVDAAEGLADLVNFNHYYCVESELERTIIH